MSKFTDVTTALTTAVSGVCSVASNFFESRTLSSNNAKALKTAETMTNLKVLGDQAARFIIDSDNMIAPCRNSRVAPILDAFVDRQAIRYDECIQLYFESTKRRR